MWPLLLMHGVEMMQDVVQWAERVVELEYLDVLQAYF
jgi:hypothetical protein